MRLFYYIHEIGNFGDELSPVIVSALLGKTIKHVEKNEISKRHRLEKFLFSLGSIFHFVNDGDVLWGTGVNANRNNPQKLTNLDIRAVRGPLSRNYIVRNYDLQCPLVFGDPALLLPKLLPGLHRNPVRKYAVIPHGADIDFFRRDDNVILPTEGWKTVVDYILGAEFVISSGLHGIIVAEAFGIPARWLRNENLPSYKNEGTFKYNDYYLATDRPPDDWAKSVEEAIRIKGMPPIRIEFNSLYNSFPHDIFSYQYNANAALARIFDRLFQLLNKR